MTTSDNKWQRVVQRVTMSEQRVITNDNEWQRMTTSSTKSDNEWHNEWQWMTTSDSEWQRVTTSDKEWQRVVQRVTTNANEWPFQLIFLFFQIKEKPITKHPKENFLNLEGDLWRRPIELKAETSTQKEILTVTSRNYRSSCSQIFTKIVFLKMFGIFSFK